MGLIRRNPRRDRNERELVAALRKGGAMVLLLSGEDLPDLLIGHRGRWVLAEVKAPRGRVKPGQAHFQTACWAMDLPCTIIHDLADVERLLNVQTGNVGSGAGDLAAPGAGDMGQRSRGRCLPQDPDRQRAGAAHRR
jgi:hypothetical protein